ncbi:DUF1360 domain-containing protein [Streptomyces sp. TRM 70351]|uniref:DUF1360 domain-containing protein n=1 Tax=Streptomyces sp. TRM 70351 TaxID=3116552 RepID=UPI002E7B74B1|nr:DUF1360 domain-containing protein [Streptomyces sp. TRM 70351]MEE1928975.1 DUF1360 domain-containing protein [Streptomyces sp. TRM 70351]
MLENIAETVRDHAKAHADAYADGAERPLGGYLKAMGVFGASVAGLALVAGKAGREWPQLPVKDIVLLTVATHKLSRIIAKDPIASPLRAPFTRYRGTSAPSELAEEVRGRGAAHTVGELVTCPFCLAPWIATALLGLHALAPRAARTCCTGLAAVAGSDGLQYAYAAAQQAEQH